MTSDRSCSSRRVLIKGAAGQVGTFLTGHLAGQYELVLSDLRMPELRHGCSFVQADITELEAMRTLCRDADTVIHLAADYRADAPWESLLPRNIVGTYNVFEAAHQAGCRRVVFTSSVHAVLGYPADLEVRASMPVRPPDLYGATKAWGEALARFYADQKGLSVICLRLGWVIDRARVRCYSDHPEVDLMLTCEDMGRLVVASIEARDELRFGIFHGISDNRRKRFDINDAREQLGYVPQDDAFALAAEAG
jgi:nucleoside-diphosphate-sugar epimerase